MESQTEDQASSQSNTTSQRPSKITPLLSFLIGLILYCVSGSLTFFIQALGDPVYVTNLANLGIILFTLIPIALLPPVDIVFFGALIVWYKLKHKSRGLPLDSQERKQLEITSNIIWWVTCTILGIVVGFFIAAFSLSLKSL